VWTNLQKAMIDIGGRKISPKINVISMDVKSQ